MRMHRYAHHDDEDALFVQSNVPEGQPGVCVQIPLPAWEAMGSPERLDVTVRPQRETPIAVARVVRT